MGIDIYARWRDMPKEDEEQQITGFATDAGKLGYLREAYHGAPYVTQHLLKEAFEADEAEAEIPAKILKQRLPEALALAKFRNDKLYNGENEKEILQSFKDFVALCEAKEKETGEPVTIRASY